MGLVNWLKNKFKKAEETPDKDAASAADLASYSAGLTKSRDTFTKHLNHLAKKYQKANDEYFDELERILIEADVGVKTTMALLDRTETAAAQQHLDTPQALNDLLVEQMFADYGLSDLAAATEIVFDPVNPTILLLVGVNGTGKTTTAAKLARRYQSQGKKVLLVAADTFRAGAVEQLALWAQKTGATFFGGKPQSDPASLCYDALQKARAENFDLVIIDTAGRLQTKDYLMAELGKVVRVIRKVIPLAPQETWLVLDANTGQNGVIQARVFKEVCPLTGLVLTKMDGTAKGGIILTIREQLGVPVRFIGLGEKEDDLKEFDPDKYFYGLLVG